MNKLTKSIRHFNIGTMITGILRSKLIDSLTQANKAAFQRHAPLSRSAKSLPHQALQEESTGVLFKILSVIQCYQSSDNNFSLLYITMFSTT